MPLRLREKIFGHPGYSSDLRMAARELEHFRGSIRSQWLKTIEAKYPDLVARFGQEGIDGYHRLADLVDHEDLWPKRNRVLPKGDAEAILDFSFMRAIRDELGEFTVSDVVHDNHVVRGTPEVYWRIVRPSVATDVGPMHADKWFHEIIGSDYGIPADATTVKLWIAVYCEPGKNGLIIVPDSHTRDWRYRRVAKNGVERPQIQEDVSSIGGQLAPTEPGTILAFHERLLHGGALNQGTTTRVSAEITLVLRGTPS